MCQRSTSTAYSGCTQGQQYPTHRTVCAVSQQKHLRMCKAVRDSRQQLLQDIALHCGQGRGSSATAEHTGASMLPYQHIAGQDHMNYLPSKRATVWLFSVQAHHSCGCGQAVCICIAPQHIQGWSLAVSRRFLRTGSSKRTNTHERGVVCHGGVFSA